MFYSHPKKRNGAYIGQSLRNKEICVCQYDPEKDDFVWRWIKTLDFVRESLEANNRMDERTVNGTNILL